MDQYRVGIQTPEYVSLQFQLAGLGSRTAAFIIDQAILMLVNVLTLLTLFFIMNGLPTTPFSSEVMTSFPVAITILVLFIVNWGYFFAFEYFSGGRTVGKKIIGIRVIQENGHSITLLSSFIRNLLRIIDSLPANYFLGMMMIFFHSKHKRIGDLVAGTIVVHERKKKGKKRLSAIEREIDGRGLSKEDLIVEEWALKSLGKKEWDLLNTYSKRFTQLPFSERRLLTKQIANIVCPKIGMEIAGYDERDIENMLLVLYLILKEEWAFEL